MGTERVRNPYRNLWKLSFLKISSFELWKHWRKKPSKSYPQSVQFAILWDGASSHSDRRTFLTNIANKGIAIHILKTLAGHRSISTTAAYLYSSPSQLKAAVELVWLRAYRTDWLRKSLMHFDIRFLTLNLDRYGGKIVVLVLSILRVANSKRASYTSCVPKHLN